MLAPPTAPASTPAPSADQFASALALLPPVEEVRDASESRLHAVLAQLKSTLDVTSRTLVGVVQAPVLVQQDGEKRAEPSAETEALVATVETPADSEVAPEPPKELTGLDLAYAQVRAREQALRTSIEDARQAAPEDIAAAQAQVAMHYEAYSLALLVAQAAARSSTPGAAGPETSIANR